MRSNTKKAAAVVAFFGMMALAVVNGQLGCGGSQEAQELKRMPIQGAQQNSKGGKATKQQQEDPDLFSPSKAGPPHRGR